MNQPLTTYIVTRSCVTGGNDYRFYRGVEEIGGAVALVLPDWPVTIHGMGLRLRYSRESGNPRASGSSSPILDARSGDEYARISWDGQDRYRIWTTLEEIQIQYQEGTYMFFRENKKIALMRSIRKDFPAGVCFQDPEWEPCMVMMTAEKLPDSLALLMLSVPLL